jgi:hypothetical protein
VLALLATLVVGVGVAGRVVEGRPGFDTVLNFERARVWVVTSELRKPCNRTSTEAWRCGSGRQELVGPTYVWTTMGSTHGVIYAHPVRNSELHIEFPEVRMGSRLDGGLGIEHDGGGNTKVDLEIRAQGQKICLESYAKGRGWDEFRCDTESLASKTVRLEFVVTCARPPSRRFVFRAWTDDVP